MSWGNKLVFVFISFAALIGTLVYKSMNTKFDLVTKDYYKEELRYQEKLDGIKNSNAISDIVVDQDNAAITIQFPEEVKNLPIEGEAWFYCKTNADKDKKLPIKLNSEGKFVIEKSNLSKETYSLKITYKAGNTSYFTEKELSVI